MGGSLGAVPVQGIGRPGPASPPALPSWSLADPGERKDGQAHDSGSARKPGPSVSREGRPDAPHPFAGTPDGPGLALSRGSSLGWVGTAIRDGPEAGPDHGTTPCLAPPPGSTRRGPSLGVGSEARPSDGRARRSLATLRPSSLSGEDTRGTVDRAEAEVPFGADAIGAPTPVDWDAINRVLPAGVQRQAEPALPSRSLLGEMADAGGDPLEPSRLPALSAPAPEAHQWGVTERSDSGAESLGALMRGGTPGKDRRRSRTCAICGGTFQDGRSIMFALAGEVHGDCWEQGFEARRELVDDTRHQVESVGAVARYLVAQSQHRLPSLLVPPELPLDAGVGVPPARGLDGSSVRMLAIMTAINSLELGLAPNPPTQGLSSARNVSRRAGALRESP